MFDCYVNYAPENVFDCYVYDVGEDMLMLKITVSLYASIAQQSSK